MEGKKGGLTEGERWPEACTPKIYYRSPPVAVLTAGLKCVVLLMLQNYAHS